jgi:hypothetical protein
VERLFSVTARLASSSIALPVVLAMTLALGLVVAGLIRRRKLPDHWAQLLAEGLAALALAGAAMTLGKHAIQSEVESVQTQLQRSTQAMAGPLSVLRRSCAAPGFAQRFQRGDELCRALPVSADGPPERDLALERVLGAVGPALAAAPSGTADEVRDAVLALQSQLPAKRESRVWLGTLQLLGNDYLPGTSILGLQIVLGAGWLAVGLKFGRALATVLDKGAYPALSRRQLAAGLLFMAALVGVAVWWAW